MSRPSRSVRAGMIAAIGAAALAFAGLSARGAAQDTREESRTAVFAGGCFWGIEAVFEHTRGVVSSVSGYANGDIPNPTYRQVTTGTTGYAESVRVTYEPSKVSYEKLLEIFFAVHDPTQLNRQGPDIGPSYRSAIFYQDDGQKHTAEATIARLTEEGRFGRDIVTAVEPLENFYEAESYHQDYLESHPRQLYIVINDLPKLDTLKEEFPDLWREEGTS
jgi:peptide-methionine (S)-S-oxide reductase